MRTIIIALITFIACNTSQAQFVKCDCNVVYDDLIEKLEENYIGLALLKNTEKYQEYRERKREYKGKVANVESENCTKILQQFLSYFEDGHLFVIEMPEHLQNESEQIMGKIKSDIISTDGILRTIEFEKDMVEKNELDGMIGQWTDGKSNFAIIKDQGYYKAYVISSTIESIEPGEIKAIFKSTQKGFEGTYYSYGYSPRYVEGNIYKEGTLLVYTGANYWGKIGDNSSREIGMINKEEINLPVIEKLDNENTLFSIPSFMADHQKFNQIILDNLDLLKNTTNLIIDIRGNVGGNALYFSFLDLYATQSLKDSQGLVLASEQTKIYFENLAKNNPQIYGSVLERIEVNMGQLVEGPDYPIRNFEPFESNIKNVAILTDKGCMSAAESFLIHSKQASTRVTTFGGPTGGVIDFTNINILKLKSGEQNIYFGYPTSTLNKDVLQEGYNKSGIIPDVLIGENEKDKIQFIINFYKHQN